MRLVELPNGNWVNPDYVVGLHPMHGTGQIAVDMTSNLEVLEVPGFKAGPDAEQYVAGFCNGLVRRLMCDEPSRNVSVDLWGRVTAVDQDGKKRAFVLNDAGDYQPCKPNSNAEKNTASGEAAYQEEAKRLDQWNSNNEGCPLTEPLPVETGGDCEVTMELHRGWTEASGTLTVESLTQSTGDDYESNPLVWRLWVANEAIRSIDLNKPVRIEYYRPATSTWSRLPDGWGETLTHGQLGVYFAGDAPPADLVALGNDARIRITYTPPQVETGPVEFMSFGDGMQEYSKQLDDLRRADSVGLEIADIYAVFVGDNGAVSHMDALGVWHAGGRGAATVRLDRDAYGGLYATDVDSFVVDTRNTGYARTVPPEMIANCGDVVFADRDGRLVVKTSEVNSLEAWRLVNQIDAQ